MTAFRKIYCCGCRQDVDARLTDGREIYQHREDLLGFPFWRCDNCGNYVGCHHKTRNPTEPLGDIPTQEIREARKKLHKLIDNILRGGKISRSEVYRAISAEIGWDYHTAKIRTIEDAMVVYKAASKLVQQHRAT